MSIAPYNKLNSSDKTDAEIFPFCGTARYVAWSPHTLCQWGEAKTNNITVVTRHNFLA